MTAIALAEIAQLSTAEHIQLAEDIWDNIVARPEEVSLSQSQADELDRRLASSQQNPQAGASWEQVRQNVQGQE